MLSIVALFLRCNTTECGVADPYCLAMVLCDNVHRDRGSGKFTLLGTFSTFAAREFPAQVNFCIYFAITDGLGDLSLWMRIVDANHGIDDESVPLFESPHTNTNFESPLVVMEGVMQIVTNLPEAGLYHCELYANQELLMSRRLVALQIEGA